MGNIQTSKSGANLYHRPNTFVLGTYDAFIQQEARYFLQEMSLDSELRSSLGLKSYSDKLEGSSLSNVIAHSLNNKSNPMHLLSKAANFLNADYYFYREPEEAVDREQNMRARFQDVAIQSLNSLDSGKLNGLKDFLPKTTSDHWHMADRIQRDMNNEIGRQALGVTLHYLLNSNQSTHKPEDIEPYVQEHIVLPYKLNVEYQQDLAHKVVGLLDMKDSMLKSFSHAQFLERYGDALDVDAFNLNSNKHIYTDAQAHSIAVPRTFLELQTGLEHFKAMGVKFEGQGRVNFPPNHRHFSTVCTREGFDINDTALREMATEFKDAVFDQAAAANPFESNQPVQASSPKLDSLAYLLNRENDSPSI
ncbi:TPA: hypothetical protein ACGUU0_003120 [Vibrio vulnificus]